MKKKILITGGAGFIGSHLCKKLLEDDNYIICLDNFYSGSENNISEFKKNTNFKLVIHDVIKPFVYSINEIYNLASPASPLHYKKDPFNTIKTNIIGSINILELAKKSEAKILQASTSEIYGDPKIHPQPEHYWGNVNPIGLRSCYNESKRCAETLFFNYYKHYNLDIKIVRIFNTYGPNISLYDGRVIGNFIISALKDEDLIIYGDGNQTRSFLYISDLIKGLIKIMNTFNNIGPINLGYPEEIKIIDLAELIINLTKSKSNIVFTQFPENDPKKRKPDISKATKILNWQPKISLEQGLIKTINYFKKKLF